MFLFYSYRIEGDTAHFDEVETRHCIQVLRKKPGDEIQFTDGLGLMCKGAIGQVGKKNFSATILEETRSAKTPSAHLHIAIAPTKNIDRFEWFLEKATEFGVSEITPVICKNSERRHLRPDRLEKVLLSAMKQSLKPFLPKLNEPAPVLDFLNTTATDQTAARFIAHCRADGLPHLWDNYNERNDVILMVGPEGDFSTEEISAAQQAGFAPVSLGRSRLRTETAGVAAVHIINLKLGY